MRSFVEEDKLDFSSPAWPIPLFCRSEYSWDKEQEKQRLSSLAFCSPE